jgi:hypothetical protein
MQAAVEHIERQLAVAKKSWAEYEERAHAAEVNIKKQSCLSHTLTWFYIDCFREISTRCWKNTKV